MIYLVKPTGDILGTLNGIKEETCKLNRNLVDMWEISFEVNKYVDDYNDFRASDYYDSIVEKMQILLETDDLSAMFIIDGEPIISTNGTQETKTITAHTTECELQHKILKLFQINNGTKTSQEYLATDNIDAYTQLPKEYIRLVNFDNHELSLLHLVLQGTNWIVDDGLKEKEPEMCSKKFDFDVNEKDVLSFLRQDVANRAKIIFDFDSKRRIVSFRSFANLGKDTGIFVGLRNLANQINIKSTSEDSLITKIKPTCGNSLGVEYVNFGDSYIYNMDYFVNAHDDNGDYLFVNQSFHDEYVAWMNLREKNRQEYINLTRDYNKNLIAIDELINRLPNDGCNIDYTTYKADELYFSLNAYRNAVASLITAYKKEYPDIYVDEDTPLDENHLKTTMYWNDYYSYTYKIIPSVMEAMKIWYETDQYDNLVVSNEDGKYIVCENGNPKYAENINIIKPVDAFKYEFELYGLDELKSKKKAWMECANLLYKDGFIKEGTKSNPQKYVTLDETEWNSLTPIQKNQFTTIESFKNTLNNYLDYMSFDERNNSITGTVCKGIIRQCEDAIQIREDTIKKLQDDNDKVKKKRDTLSSSVRPDEFFSQENLRIFRLFTKETNYTNENIVTTTLNDIVSMIDIAEELYQDACNYLSTISQPQYSFTTSIDNLFAMEDFQPMRSDFTIGNFVRLLPDLFSDDFIRLRLISIELNPLMKSPDISIEFSTMTKSLSNLSDLSFMFGKNSSSGSISGSSGSSSCGTYGTNDAEIQIANNMLNALLNTELFGTQVTDVILDSIRANKGNFGKLIAHSGIFDSLEAGETKINGACLTDIIKSLNYVAGTEGSMLDLKDGAIDFAGSSITYDKTKGLIIKGEKGKTSIDGDSVNTGSIKSNNYNGTAIDPLGNTKGSIIDLANGMFNFGGGKLKFQNDTLNVIGDITANNLTANNSGTIAGWYFDNTGFYKLDATGKKQMVIGNNGITAGEEFSIMSNGQCNIKNVESINCNDSLIADENGTIIKNNRSYNVYSNGIDFSNMKHLMVVGATVPSIVPKKNINVVLPNLNIGDDFNIDINVAFAISRYIFNVCGTVKSNCFFPDEFNNNIYEPFISSIICKYNSTDKELSIEIPSYVMSSPVDGETFSNVISINSSKNQIARVIIDDEDQYNGDILYTGNGMKIDTIHNKINGDLFDLSQDNLSMYKDFAIQYFESFDSDTPIIEICKDRLYHNGLTSISSGTNIVSSDGYFFLKSSSSKRYKHDIRKIEAKEQLEYLDPQKLYDIDVVTFKYNEDYLQKDDPRYNKDIPGFIAEDIYEKYPIACNLDSEGKPEMWEINILFPAALKLIQEQHEEIEQFKKRIEILEQKLS